MEKLISEILELKQNNIGKLVEKRMREFEKVFEDEQEVFSELCFCITTANSSAEMGIKVQNALNGRLENYDKKSLAKKLRSLGYRFYNKRAEYMIKAYEKWKDIKKIIENFDNSYDEYEIREWLKKNILGIGYKEASHFMRNVGYKNLAILDRHVLRIMHENKMIPRIPDNLSRKRYLEYEKKLLKLCEATDLRQGELDMYLWHMKTGKILK